ncbi:MAG: iron-only hydrogenase system regulator [Proteobacteria bacterium]|nr:iron-only hydrogenase system regulator [Pseudomonadota bacterium]
MSEETRVAVLGIIIENPESVEALNAIVHEYRDIVLGRMGIPYRQKKINIVSLAVDAPSAVINALSGKIGRLPGITVKTAYAHTSHPSADQAPKAAPHTPTR